MKKIADFVKVLIPVNLSSYYIAALGAGVFFVGHYYSDLSDWLNKKSTFNQRVLATMMVSTSGGLLKFIDSMISDDKEAALTVAAATQKEAHEEELERYKIEVVEPCLDELESILKREYYRDSKHHKAVSRLLEKLQQGNERIALHRKHRQQSCVIANWLDEKVNGQHYGNRYQLVNVALDAAKINGEVAKLFDSNIQGCIQWLRSSLEYGEPCKLEAEQASALFSGALTLEPYVQALNAIKYCLQSNEDLEHLKYRNVVVDYFVNALIEQMQKHAAASNNC